MNWKRFAAAFIGVLILTALMNFVIHAVLLKADYAAQPALIRSEADGSAHMLYLMLAFVIFALGFTLLWDKWARDRRTGVADGLVFGILAWLLVSVNRYLTYYAVQPWPASVVCKQIVYELVWCLSAGILVALIYGRGPAPQRS